MVFQSFSFRVVFVAFGTACAVRLHSKFFRSTCEVIVDCCTGVSSVIGFIKSMQLMNENGTKELVRKTLIFHPVEIEVLGKTLFHLILFEYEM